MDFVSLFPVSLIVSIKLTSSLYCRNKILTAHTQMMLRHFRF